MKMLSSSVFFTAACLACRKHCNADGIDDGLSTSTITRGSLWMMTNPFISALDHRGAVWTFAGLGKIEFSESWWPGVSPSLASNALACFRVYKSFIKYIYRNSHQKLLNPFKMLLPREFCTVGPNMCFLKWDFYKGRCFFPQSTSPD